MSERSAVQFGNTRIAFDVKRSARRKTVALTVGTAGELTVTAPPHVPLARLDAVVKAKARWVVVRVKRASERPPAPPAREFVTGEGVLYLGRHYRLKVLAGTNRRATEATLHGGWLVVRGAGGAPEVRRALVGWLRERAEAYLPLRLEKLCARRRVIAPRLLVTEQRTRWGSCDARGTLRINWRIIQAPLALVDYVLLHELTHLDHPSHGTAFWAALERWLPDHNRCRARLEALGPALIW